MSAPESNLLQWPQAKSEPVTRALYDQVMIGVYTPSEMIPVKGLGSPEPPRPRARPATWRVCCAITAMSRLDVPTSSAVT